MKPSLVARFSWLTLLAGLFVAGCATTPRVEVPGTLKVQVNTPMILNFAAEDRVSEAFVDRVRDVFVRSGFDRPIDEVRFADHPAHEPYLLTVNLTEWRVDPVGNINCTFQATIQTPQGTRELGIYSNMTPSLARGFGRFALGRAFDDAATNAIYSMWRDIAKSALLPPLRRTTLPTV